MEAPAEVRDAVEAHGIRDVGHRSGLIAEKPSAFLESHASNELGGRLTKHLFHAPGQVRPILSGIVCQLGDAEVRIGEVVVESH